MKYLKFQPGIYILPSSRNRRELRVANEVGYEVLVFGADKTKPDDKEFSSYTFIYDNMTKLSYNIPKIKRMLIILRDRLQLVKLLQATDTDIISCHDIYALQLAYIARAFMRKKPKLIYDSHEFEIGRNTKRSKIAKWFISHQERFLMKRCAFSIMVNDSIADEVQRIHKLHQRPIVVRNVSPLWERDETACARIRHGFCQALGMPDDTFLVMYHGGILPNRGVENMMATLALVKDAAGIILGYGNQNYVATLKKMAHDLGIENRIMFHEAVPHNILMNYVGAVDCGLVTVLNSCTSYYYMLPNKFFENIQSETPIIGSNFPEISRLILKYDIGLLCDPSKPEEIAQCITKMRDDRALYTRCKANLKLAKRELCWEKEKLKLIKEYERSLNA